MMLPAIQIAAQVEVEPILVIRCVLPLRIGGDLSRKPAEIMPMPFSGPAGCITDLTEVEIATTYWLIHRLASRVDE